jgi:hypothetical protein
MIRSLINWKEGGPDMIEVLFRHFLEGLSKTTEASVSVASVPTEIRTERLSHTSLKLERYANLLDSVILFCHFNMTLL